MSRTPVQKNNIQKSALYKVVFDVVAVRYVVVFMFMFFVLHPAVPAFAAEEVSEDTDDAAQTALASEPEPEPVEEMPESDKSTVDEEVVEGIETEESPEILEEMSGSTNEDATNIVPTQDDETLVEEQVSEDDESVTQEEDSSQEAEESSLGDSSSEEPVESSDQESTTGSDKVEEPEDSQETDLETMSQLLVASSSDTTQELPVTTAGPDTSTTSSTEVSETNSEEDSLIDATDSDSGTTPVTHATTTANVPSESDLDTSAEEEIVSVELPTSEVDVDTVATTTKEIVYITVDETSDANRHKFSENQCVSVGDGAFYCQTPTQDLEYQTDAVFTKRDTTGDTEVFVSVHGKERQLTDNAYEDEAPSYDALTKQVVFQRLLEGRYQVFQFDLTSNTETQLSKSSENSMQPTQYNGMVVWQEWVTNNWDIMLYTDGEIISITNSAQHDVAPSIRGNYVIWHTTDNGEKMLGVYDLDTGVISKIEDPDGGQVANPRFVLVYDTTFDNGDTVTKSYDPVTGEVRPVAAIPATPSTPIPSPDQTGETSAILNIKTSLRDEALVDDEGNFNGVSNSSASSTKPVAPSTPTKDASSSATTTTALDAVPVDVDLSASSSIPLQLSDFDLIVEPFGATTTHAIVSTSTVNTVE